MQMTCEALLGDCSELLPQILQKAREEQRTPILVSDPPFNIGYDYASYSDRMDEGEYWTWMSSIFSQAPSAVVHYPEQLHRLSFEMGMFPERIISWVYNSNMRKQHRDIAYYRVSPVMAQVKQPYKNQTDKRILKLIAEGSKGATHYDWIYSDQVKNVSGDKVAGHHCQMPVDVMKLAAGVLPKDALIIDPFMGTGTTGVAVMQLNDEGEGERSFIGIDIDEGYVRASKERMGAWL